MEGVIKLEDVMKSIRIFFGLIKDVFKCRDVRKDVYHEDLTVAYSHERPGPVGNRPLVREVNKDIKC